MIEFNQAIDEGIIIRYDDLRGILKQISHDKHQWSLGPPLDRNGGYWVQINYTNPDSFLSELHFLFPVAALGMGDETLICLHPTTAISLRDGLYMEGDKIMLDAMEDWLAFWPPISEALGPFRANAGSSTAPSVEECSSPS